MEEDRLAVIKENNLTMAEITKMDSTREWSGDPKISYEEAIKQVFEKGKCSKENIESKKGFTSELSSISAIVEICNLSKDDAEKMEEEFFSKGSFSEELSKKIRDGLNSGAGIEANVVEILRNVHNGWVIDNKNNFQGLVKGKDGKPDKKRDKDYQFVDLLLMSYGADGATADLVFLKPILEGCGITIDMDKLEKAFMEKSKAFLEEKGIDGEDKLLQYIQSGDYEPLQGLETEANGLKQIDVVDLDRNTIPITELLKRPEISKHMTEQVLEKNGYLRKMLGIHNPEEARGYGAMGRDVEKGIKNDITNPQNNKNQFEFTDKKNID